MYWWLGWDMLQLPVQCLQAASSDNGKRFTFCGNADNSLIALISEAGCPGIGSAGVFMFWKFPEFVKCARRSRAHLTDSGNFQNIHIPVQ